MAKYLSATSCAPFLDLAELAVATGSLKGLISDLVGNGDAVTAFHAGQIPIIVDALDEGRLRSGENGFEKFLETSFQFILQNRSNKNSTKLLFIGRHDSIDNALTWLSLVGEGITHSVLSVEFFKENDARKLIDVYAQKSAPQGAAYFRHKKAANELIDAYFSAIEGALVLNTGDLWKSEAGLAFAGYAPVLAALGGLLSELENFSDVATRLKSEGRREAWTVIETVLDEILSRESGKLCEKLKTQIDVPIPAETYDVHEQMLFCTRYLHNMPLGASTRVKMPPSDQVKYYDMVKQLIVDHPFIRMNNTVLQSKILAHSIINDLLGGIDSKPLIELSRQPFLWRFLRTEIEKQTDLLIDGLYLGYFLNSYWNDPVIKSPTVVIRMNIDGSASVEVGIEGGKNISFRIISPIYFHGQIRKCNLDTTCRVVLNGTSFSGSAKSIHVHEDVNIRCASIDVTAENINIDGKFWLEAAEISSSPRLFLSPKKGSEVGWGAAVQIAHPWNELSSTLSSPYIQIPSNVLSELIDACASRLPNGVFVTNDDYASSDNENRWASRDFPNAFPQMIKMLCDHKLARAEKFGTYAQQKFRIHMDFTWLQLKNALTINSGNLLVDGFVADARANIITK
jgi:hypothetical protein